MLERSIARARTGGVPGQREGGCSFLQPLESEAEEAKPATAYWVYLTIAAFSVPIVFRSRRSLMKYVPD